MLIEVAGRRRKAESIKAAFPDAIVVDVTSRGQESWVQLSPFYPHGGIPVPLTPDVVGASVEGIWQALKVFDGADVDPAKLSVTTMTGLKRTNGPVSPGAPQPVPIRHPRSARQRRRGQVGHGKGAIDCRTGKLKALVVDDW